MLITIASYKGGVGKTTTAVHVAAFLNAVSADDKAVLLDGDQTRNATAWSQRGIERGKCFPFPVRPIDQAAKMARTYTHLVIDTGQRPSAEDMRDAADACDLMIVPAVPSALDTDGLGQTIRALQAIEGAKFKVLLTRVAPDATKEVQELRELLRSIGVSVFDTEIPRLKAFEKAAALGTTVDLVDDRNAERAWAAYQAVGQEMTL